ncbi:hypothetical protein [Cyanobium sp. ATX-6F1]|uniref:hypothetical protein n=1 Tax=Cyanobium sp. ATX-6F1 TaxID=3137388 RepID=UPI0039BE679E
MSLSLVLAALIAATPSAPKAAQSKAVEPLGPPQYLPIEAEWCLPPLASATGVLAPPAAFSSRCPVPPVSTPGG